MDMTAPTTSMAISCMWAWMVPHFYIEFTEYRLVLDKIKTCDNENNIDKNNADRSDRVSNFDIATRSTVQGVCSAIGIIGVVYVATVLGVGISTTQPDPNVLTKSDAMAIGVGRMLSACLLAYFSVELPRWLGVSYASQKHVKYYKQFDEKNIHHELSFRVCWSFLGHFFVMYPFLIFYFCNTSNATVAISTAVGIVFGFAIVYCVWLGHTKLNYKNRTLLAVFLSLGITVSSAAAFAAGCWYVKEVWHDNNEFTEYYTFATFSVWLFLWLLVHGVHFRLTQRKVAEAAEAKQRGVSTAATSTMDETEVELDAEDIVICPESVKGEWRYQKQVFQPPRSIHCLASELQNSFTSLPSLLKKTKQNVDSDENNINVSCIDQEDYQSGSVTCEVTGLNIDFDPDSAQFSFGECHMEFAEKTEEREMNLSSNSMDELSEEEDSVSVQKSLESNVPTLWYMVRVNSCCRKRRHYNVPQRKGWNRFIAMCKWTLWIIVAVLHVMVTIINIGATQQQARVRGALAGTYEAFYPKDYTVSTMCAWNESSPDADIRTFDSLDAVVAANYTVLHCGACGHCSNWNDLSLQWTTRDRLADLAKSCTTQSFFGSIEDVHECNKETIGFTDECAMCWTEDELCARDNCSFIYLQSVFTNQVNNYNVGPDDITSATCDEALCGPEFVPCVGATRRRMNIVSDIPRPESQQCNVASEVWSAVFNHP